MRAHPVAVIVFVVVVAWEVLRYLVKLAVLVVLEWWPIPRRRRQWRQTLRRTFRRRKARHRRE